MSTLEKPPVLAPPQRRRRRIQRAGALALASALLYIPASVLSFVVPHTDPLPAHADVAFALGDTTPQRITTAMTLLRQDRVGAVQFSVAGQGGPGTPVAQAEDLCATTAQVYCARPVPYTTQGEARMLRDAAQAHGWSSAVLITKNAQLLRGRWIVGRCFAGSITLRASGEPPMGGWVREIVYQTLASVKNAVITPGC